MNEKDIPREKMTEDPLDDMKKLEQITISEKVVRGITQEEKLAVKSKRKKRYDAYKGEASPAVPNKINRDFHADRSSEKWLTGITEFSIPAGKVYLSLIVDRFDGMLAHWTIGIALSSTLIEAVIIVGRDGSNECRKLV